MVHFNRHRMRRKSRTPHQNEVRITDLMAREKAVSRRRSQSRQESSSTRAPNRTSIGRCFHPQPSVPTSGRRFPASPAVESISMIPGYYGQVTRVSETAPTPVHASSSSVFPLAFGRAADHGDRAAESRRQIKVRLRRIGVDHGCSSAVFEIAPPIAFSPIPADPASRA